MGSAFLGSLWFLVISAGLSLVLAADVVESMLCLLFISVWVALLLVGCGLEYLGALLLLVYAGALIVLLAFGIFLLPASVVLIRAGGFVGSGHFIMTVACLLFLGLVGMCYWVASGDLFRSVLEGAVVGGSVYSVMLVDLTADVGLVRVVLYYLWGMCVVHLALVLLVAMLAVIMLVHGLGVSVPVVRVSLLNQVNARTWMSVSLVGWYGWCRWYW